MVSFSISDSTTRGKSLIQLDSSVAVVFTRACHLSWFWFVPGTIIASLFLLQLVLGEEGLLSPPIPSAPRLVSVQYVLEALHLPTSSGLSTTSTLYSLSPSLLRYVFVLPLGRRLLNFPP